METSIELYINEFQSNNETTYADEADEYDDELEEIKRQLDDMEEKN